MVISTKPAFALRTSLFLFGGARLLMQFFGLIIYSFLFLKCIRNNSLINNRNTLQIIFILNTPQGKIIRTFALRIEFSIRH